MQKDRFSKFQLDQAKALLKNGKVKPPLFSEGTYQFEVIEPQRKVSHWPFLHIDDEGHLLDCFCDCSQAEKNKTCVHLAAAYQKIFYHHSLPLHVRFRNAFWNQLCLMASRRHGYDPSVIKQKKGKGEIYEGFSSTHKRLFFLEGLNNKGKEKIKELLFARLIETEETSLKFSHLPAEELAKWKAGRPSFALQYELSFWADLAKWLMTMQEEGNQYTIAFQKEGELLPDWVDIHFSCVSIGFYISSVNWPKLIPTLSSVHSPLKVYDFHESFIESIQYDIQQRCLIVHKTTSLKEAPEFNKKPKEGSVVGDWIYLPNKGFFPKKMDPIFKQETISQEHIGTVLQKHPQILQRFLKEIPIFITPVSAHYQIYLDHEANLHITCYAFEPGDLQKRHSAYFGPWVYIQDKGFYPLENQLFSCVEKRVSYKEMNDFINRHRVFLGGFEGFQTHVSTVESQLIFTLSKEGVLCFENSLEMIENEEGVIDFGEWIYLKGRGFFGKRMGGTTACIPPGTVVPKEEISSFIRKHKEELEALPGFFASRCPLEKIDLEIFLNQEGRIVVRPHFCFFPTPFSVQVFGDYTYVENEGFYEIPYEKKVPESYMQEKEISLKEEPYFVLYELEALAPSIFSLQKELQRPQSQSIKIVHFKRKKKERATDWILEAVLETEIGQAPLYLIWEALQQNHSYLFSSAGLLYLKAPRFNWMKALAKRQWLKEGTQLSLTTLDWLKLNVFETVKVSDSCSAKDQKIRQIIEEINSFRPDEWLDLTGFKSALRTYQEFGVKWLFFLYSHGLSGLLCDEMGLGKTHQAMGLISAVQNQMKQKEPPIQAKVLVVCPTSVLYHWEGLLKNFLPEVKVEVFYGVTRSLDPLHLDADLLLTSYGTLRSEKALISKIAFEIAIFDELQVAKNPQSQVHKALRQVKANMRLGLTGTPIENRLLELKALFDIIVPSYLPQEAQFKELFVHPIEKEHNEEKKRLFSKLIKPFLLRRKKADVLLELPEKIEEMTYCDLSEEQKVLYRKVYIEHKQSFSQSVEDNKKGVKLIHVFSLLSKLKQICDHPCLVTKQPVDFAQHQSGKWDCFVELLQEIRDSNQKVVVFSQYLGMLDIMQQYLDKEGIRYASIRGSTRNRKEELETFRDDPKCEVFLASLQAVGVGVDLVSASVVIHYDRWWNPAREAQATDRVHRIGQRRGVQVFKLVTKKTIEEHIHQLIEKKLLLTQGVLHFDEHDQIKGLDKEELMRLLWLIDQDIH